MASSWVIRLLQAGKNQTPILVKVAPKEGGHSLDFDLLATNGDEAYSGKIRQRSLKKLRAKHYDGSDNDWTDIVSYTLAPQKGSSLDTAQRQNLEVTCSISGKDPHGTLSIAFSNRIEEITQRLGTIELPQTEETDDVNLFEWALQAIEKRDELAEEVTNLRGEINTKDEVVSSLRKQIDELVKAKAEHETQMLSKFALLLNEKKLKIRNMQRVMSNARIDQKKLKELQDAIGNEPTSAGHRNKRQAEEVVQDEESDESDAFEPMDVDIDPNTPRDLDSPQSGASTPIQSATEDEENDALDAQAPSTDRPRTRALDLDPKQSIPTTLPPPRELPFQKKTGQQNNEAAEEAQLAKPRATPADDEETETEEEEL